MILGKLLGIPKPFSKIAVKNLALVAGLSVFGSQASAFYYPPGHIPPNPPPNYNQIDSMEFQGTPSIPLPPPDSGGIYIYRDSGKWNVANHIYSKGGSLEQFHGSVLAQMSQPPELGVNVFIMDFELWGDTSSSLCLDQNDRWGWVQWDSSLYEIWWDVTTKEFKPEAQDINDFMRIRIVGCALDFNVWSSGHGGPFGPDQIYLGQSMTRLSDVVGYIDTTGVFVNAPFVDTYSGISDPYQSQAGSDPTGDPNITVFSSKALPGASYNLNGLIKTTDSYPCDPTYGQRYTGTFAYEGNGIQFTTACQEPTNAPPQLIVTGDTTVFLCDPTEICIQLHGEDDDDDHMTLRKLIGAGYFPDYSSDSSFDTLHCFIPDTSGTYCFVFELDDDAFLRGVIESDDDEDTICVTVVLNSPPTANCSGDITVPNDIGQCGAIVTYSSSVTDDQSGATIECIPVSGSFFPLGTTVVTCIATDTCGLADTCTFNVTVNDTEPPVANCSADITVANDPGQCGAVVNYTSTATDNCPGVSIVCTPPSGSTFPVGVTAVTCIATDAAGNADTCSFNVTVIDAEPPAASCSADITVANDPGQCGAVVNYTSTVADNCPGATIACTPPSGSTFPVGVTTVTCIATDASGNADTCSFNVTVNDTEPPAISCPAPVSVQCSADIPAPDVLLVSASDNCPGVVVTFVSDSSDGQSCPETVYRTYKATDASNNSSLCTQTITVDDTIPPVPDSCPSDMTIACNAGFPDTAVVTATDNCDPNPTITFSETITPGNCPQEMTILRKWVVSDVCGNEDSCLQTINVVDNQAPVFVDCPTTITVECDNIPNPASPSAVDSCDPNPIVTYLGETTTAGSCPQQYTLTRRWEAKDACGNADTCSQDIIVVDTTPPVFVDCPTSITVECDAIPNPASPSAVDSCDPNPIVTYLGETTTAGSCPQQYTLTRKWEAKDACGNADTCSQDINVVDTTPPDITSAPSNLSLQCLANIPPIDPGDISASDNCGSVIIDTNRTDNGGSGCLNDPLVITDTYTVSDECGNSVQHVRTITVEDDTPPICNVPQGTTIFSCSIATFCLPVSAVDNCDPNPVCVIDSGPGTLANGEWCYQPGTGSETVQVVFKCTDNCNNSCYDTLNVQFVINTPPQIVSVDTTDVLICNPGDSVIVPITIVDPDNTLGGTSLIGAFNHLDSTVRFAADTAGRYCDELIVFDSCGLADTANYCIDVSLNGAPSVAFQREDTVGCPGDSICVSYTVSDPDNNVVTEEVIQGALSPSIDAANNRICFEAPSPGNYQLIVKVTDSCGLTAFDTLAVEILGPPEPSCPGDVSLFVCDLSQICLPGFFAQNADTAYIVGGTLKNDTACFIPVPGANPIVFVASNRCGTVSCTTIVNVTLNSPPEVSCPPNRVDSVCGFENQICVSGFSVTDPDNNLMSCTINGQPFDPAGAYCFTPLPGDNNLVFTCTDSCGAISQCTVTITVDSISCDPCPHITIEKRHNTIQGQYESVSITLDNMTYAIGGFDLLIEYDPTALALSTVDPGSFIIGCGWEYFSYRHGASGNCGSNACPTGKIRLISVAEVNNGANHPSCFQASSAELAVLTFLVSNDRTLECQFVPIRFCWYDCGDNTLSSVNGDTLYLSSRVFEYYDGIIYTDITNISAPFPSLFGANYTCDNTAPEGKPNGIRCIDFYNGGVDIVCADSIDLRGDVNLNGVSNEVSDVVLFSNYFIYGLSVFTVNVQGQIAATDVNADGAVLSVADLVYLIRIVVGDAAGFSKVVTPVDVKYSHYSDGRLTVGGESSIGAAYVVVKGESQPVLLADGMEMKYSFDGANTRILVWSADGQSFTGDLLQADGDIVSIEMATAEGNPAAMTVVPTEYKLSQNYPNPFNPTTVIGFALPSAADYNLNIYNVKGQLVESISGNAESAGEFEIEWNAGNYASGVYFYKLTAGNFTATRKMILLK